jgi:hypothetical protein
MQGRMTDFLFQVLSSLLLCKHHYIHLKDTHWGFLVLTHDYCLQHKCKVLQHKLPIPDAHSLFNMPLDLRLGPLSSSSFLSINPSCQCFKDIHNYSAKLLAQRRISTTRQAVCRNQKPHPSSPSQKPSKIKKNFSLYFPHFPMQLPSPARSPCSSVFSFFHKLPMHRYHPPFPKIINPAAFIKKVDGGFNS